MAKFVFEDPSISWTSPSLHVHAEEGADITYVVFSSMDIPVGNFMFWRVMGMMPGNKIFLNDEHNGWFSHGVHGLGGSVEETAEGLLRIIHRLGAGTTVFLGPSMGGYGATLYGSLLRPKLDGVVRCLSFGGEIVLDLRGTRSLQSRGKPPNPLYDDLRPHLVQSGLDVSLVIGEDDISDAYQAYLAVQTGRVRALSLMGADHAVSTWIGRKYNLADFIRRFGETGDLLTYPDTGSLLEKGRAAKHVFFGHFALMDKRIEEGLDHFAAAAALAGDNHVVQHKLGIAYFEAGRYEEAIGAQKTALGIRRNFAHAHYHVGLSLRALGRIEDAIAAFGECCSCRPNHQKARLQMIELHLSLGQLYEAERHLDPALKLDPANRYLVRLMKDTLTRSIAQKVGKLADLAP